MSLYSYRCRECGEPCDIFHPMAELGQERACPICGGSLKRVLLPIHHGWPDQYKPGYEHSGQRMLLDPEYQARKKDYNARIQDERKARGDGS